MIDPDSDVPKSRQLAAILRDLIDRGELTRRLPSERELAERFGVAAGTVRAALKVLRAEHYIETYHGAWSRILPPEERGARE